jgi:hypothetical protein
VAGINNLMVNGEPLWLRGRVIRKKDPGFASRQPGQSSKKLMGDISEIRSVLEN